MKPRFLFLSDILDLISSTKGEPRLSIYTVMEPIEIVEAMKKARISLESVEFEQGWDWVSKQHYFVFLALDVECLQRSLFQNIDGSLNNDFWIMATDAKISPNQTIRRLILRPSEQTWWDEEIYNEVEKWYAEFKDV